MVAPLAKSWDSLSLDQKKMLWPSIKAALMLESNEVLSVNFLSFGFGVLYQTTILSSFDLSETKKKQIIQAMMAWNSDVQKLRKDLQTAPSPDQLQLLASTTLRYIKANRPHWLTLQKLLSDIEVR